MEKKCAFSFDIKGKFAFFKKNDGNDVVLTTYNFIHKPAVLGIIGAILGYSGYSKAGEGQFPEYYDKLKKLKIAIKPHYNKPLKKTIVYFNNATGLASDKRVWQVKEQILVGEPEVGFTIFVLDNSNGEKENPISCLKDKLGKRETEFNLYFGKNEFFAYYDNFKEYVAEKLSECNEVNIYSLIKIEKEDESFKNIELKTFDFEDFDPFSIKENIFTIFENLPYDFDENGFYKKSLFIFTNGKIKIKEKDNFYSLKQKSEKGEINVQFI